MSESCYNLAHFFLKRKCPDSNGDAAINDYWWFSRPLPYQLGLHFQYISVGPDGFEPPTLTL